MADYEKELDAQTLTPKEVMRKLLDNHYMNEGYSVRFLSTTGTVAHVKKTQEIVHADYRGFFRFLNPCRRFHHWVKHRKCKNAVFVETPDEGIYIEVSPEGEIRTFSSVMFVYPKN